MTKTLIKSTLILAAILLSGTKVQAQVVPLPAGTKLQMQTSEVGGTIAGLSTDGKFFAILCGSGKTSADLLFQNSEGDVQDEYHNTPGYRLRTWTPPRSLYVSFSSEAAVQVCSNPNGSYVFETGLEGNVQKLRVTNFQADTRDPKSLMPTAGRLQVRTGQVGNKVVAVTDDARFFAIVCTRGMVWSSADLIFPNTFGKIVVKDYNISHVRVSPAPRDIAKYYPMTAKAVSTICNFPNGIYALDVAQKDAKTEVEFIGGESFEANVRFGSSGRGRGF